MTVPHNETGAAYVGRLAPAPTGALHVGNARTFLVAWLRARQAGGTLLLRMEDLDHPKVKAHAAEEVYHDLHWLGLDWDDGADRHSAFFTQSARAATYRALLDRLIDEGRAYPCRCRRKDWAVVQSAPQEGDPHEYRYPGTCRPPPRKPGLSSVESSLLSLTGDRGIDVGADDPRAASDAAARERPPEGDARPPAWRFALGTTPGENRFEFMDGCAGVQGGDLSTWSGDFLIARDREHAGYALAVVADDHAMGVTEVVRGDDLLPSTQRQLALYRALGWTPPTFFHVPLVVGADGRRLAKRHGDTRLSVWRREGRDPSALLAWLARTLGVDVTPNERGLRPVDVLERFNPTRIPRDRVVWTPETERVLWG